MDTKELTIEIRATESIDIPRIYEIENASFSVPWSRKSFVSVLSLENFYSLTAVCNNITDAPADRGQAPVICGFVIFTVAADEGEILDGKLV